MSNVGFANWVIDSIIIPYQKHLEESKNEKTKKEIHVKGRKKGRK